MKRQINLSQKVWTRLDYWFAFGFGSGLAPYAPGTFGTLAAVPIYYYVMMNLSPLSYLTVLLAAFLGGVYVCSVVSMELGEHDFQGIVCDEIVGYLLTMFLAPVGLSWMILGFCLFRLFDIWKPFFVGWVDSRVKGGLGIMLDDVVAALPAMALLQLIHFLIA